MIQDGLWRVTKPGRLSFAALFFVEVLLLLSTDTSARPSNNIINTSSTVTNTTTTPIVTNTTYNNETTTTTTYSNLGLDVLEQMQQEDRLTTPFSQRDHVLQFELVSQTRSGTPSTWKPCVMKQILDRSTGEDANINILVLGGSMAARPGNGCGTPTDPYAGRYSNFLQAQLNSRNNSSRFQFNVINSAQGAELSALGALTIDGRIDMTMTTDMIVWDYATNDDSYAGGHAEEIRKLDFWLTRLAVQLANNTEQKSKPPPILLLYLWTMRAGNKLQRKTIHTLNKDPLSYMGGLLERYRDLGWDISLVNVGGAVNSTYLQQGNNVRQLFDDSIHPSCRGTQFIADLLEHTMWSNLATECSELDTEVGVGTGNNNSSSSSSNYTETANINAVNPEEIIPSHDAIWPNTGTRFQELWKDLFDPQAMIGSISPWTPRIPGQSNLNYTLRFNESAWPLEVAPIHTQASRADRKYGYRLPRCEEEKLVIVLTEPHLKWIGLALLGAPSQLQINNQTVQLQDYEVDQWNYGRSLLSHWIQLPEEDEKETTHWLSFCHQYLVSDEEMRERNGDALLPNLQFLIGVTVP